MTVWMNDNFSVNELSFENTCILLYIISMCLWLKSIHLHWPSTDVSEFHVTDRKQLVASLCIISWLRATSLDDVSVPTSMEIHGPFTDIFRYQRAANRRRVYICDKFSLNMFTDWCSSTHPAAAGATAAAYLSRRQLLSAIAATCRSSCVNSSGLWTPINRSFAAEAGNGSALARAH